MPEQTRAPALPILDVVAGVCVAATGAAAEAMTRPVRWSVRKVQPRIEDWLGMAVPRILDLVLDQIDLTEIVLRRVDLDRIAATLDVDAVAARIDLDAIVDRIQLIALAEYVVNGIDLPRIIRESTGSVASESLREVRTRSIEADQALAQFMDRLLMRRRSSRSVTSGGEGGSRAAENGAAIASAAPPGDLDAD